MNLLLFGENESHVLNKTDSRFEHIRSVLRLGIGDELKAGIVGKGTGRARIRELNEHAMYLDFELLEPPKPFYPLHILLGAVRPICLQRILRDLSAMGVARVSVFSSELGEKSYLAASLWQGDAVEKLLLEGAAQGANTLLPKVEKHYSLRKLINDLQPLPQTSAPPPTRRLCFDLPGPWAEATCQNISEGSLSQAHLSLDSSTPLCLAIGTERGWTDNERRLFAGAGFAPAFLGDRILRTETAVVAAVSAILTRMGCFMP